MNRTTTIKEFTSANSCKCQINCLSVWTSRCSTFAVVCNRSWLITDLIFYFYDSVKLTWWVCASDPDGFSINIYILSLLYCWHFFSFLCVSVFVICFYRIRKFFVFVSVCIRRIFCARKKWIDFSAVLLKLCVQQVCSKSTEINSGAHRNRNININVQYYGNLETI